MKKRILLVEDHIDMLDLLEKALRFLGYETVIAKNGLEAVEMAESENPDLIVLDIALPKLNGFDVTTQIRKNLKTRLIPIIAATATAMPGDREKCLMAGCDDYLAKPFTPVELAYVIEEVLKRQSSQKTLSPRKTISTH